MPLPQERPPLPRKVKGWCIRTGPVIFVLHPDGQKGLAIGRLYCLYWTLEMHGNATDDFAGMPRPPPCCAYKLLLALPRSNCCSRDDMVIFARWTFCHDRLQTCCMPLYALSQGPSAKPNSSALVVVFLQLEGVAMMGSMFAEDCQLRQQCPEGMARFLHSLTKCPW